MMVNERHGGPGTEQLRPVVQDVLDRYFGRSRAIVRFAHAPFDYSTSAPLHTIQLILEDDTPFRLLLKDVSRSALPVTVLQAKPAFLYHPLREIETYRTILMPEGLSTAICYGAHVDPRSDRYWLFLEYVPGWTLFESEADVWPLAMRWLAALHLRFARMPDLLSRGEQAHLVRYDADLYSTWQQRAAAFLQQVDLSREDQRKVKRLMSGYHRVVERLIAFPPTFIHGEFFASNVIIQNGNRVCPIDWETAAVGPGLIDVAAMVAGSWSTEARTSLAHLYWQELPVANQPSFETFMADLDCCRLHLAMQWLGWAAEWSPPPEHRQNWLMQALQLADSLEL